MNFKRGTRIRLISMDDPAPLPADSTGRIYWISKVGDGMVLSVSWDAPHQHRTMNLLYPDDKFEIIEE